MKPPVIRVRSLALLAAWLLLALPAFAQPTPLERARTEQVAGNFEVASAYWRQVLAAEPDNAEGLAGFCDAMGALGRWRECVPYLERLVALQPDNGQRLWEFGQMSVWMGRTSSGLALMKRALEMLPESADRSTTYATALTWTANTREEGIVLLRDILSVDPGHDDARRSLARALSWQGEHAEAIAAARPLTSRDTAGTEDLMLLADLQAASGNDQAELETYRRALDRDPNDVELIRRLAPVLSWDADTRGEAAQLYERAIHLEPDNDTLLIMYAEMLSWNGPTRARAVTLFDRALAMNPGSDRARLGKAQVLAWSGLTEAALAQYDAILAQDPASPAALRGKATLLMWREQNKEAREMLLTARAAEPGEAATLVELARADVGVRRFEEARDTIEGVPHQPGEDWRILQRDVRQGLGTYVESGFGLRSSSGNLDYSRVYAAISTPVDEGRRLTARFRPTLFDTKPGDFNSNYYALALDARLSDTATLSAEIGGETYSGEAASSFDGALDVRARLGRGFRLYTGFRRASVDESLTAARGTVFGGSSIGQVRSNLGTIGGSYAFDAKTIDLTAVYTDGAFTGRNLEANRRQSVDVTVGKTLRGFRPFLRAVYGFSFLHFDHDSSFVPGGGPLRRAGNYYSPYQSVNNYAGVSLNYRLGTALEWGASATAGVTTTRGLPLSPWDSRFTGPFSTSVVWHATDSNTIRLNYDYIDVFNAYRYNFVGISWRHYF